jgi:hypothetical protein
MLPGRIYFLYRDDVRTSQETPTGLHGLLRGWRYFLYVDDVRTSQETTTGLHGLLRKWFYFFICRWCSYRTGNTCGTPRPVSGIKLHLRYSTQVIPEWWGCHWIACWLRPSVILDDEEKRIIPSQCRTSNLGRPAPNNTELWWFLFMTS